MNRILSGVNPFGPSGVPDFGKALGTTALGSVVGDSFGNTGGLGNLPLSGFSGINTFSNGLTDGLGNNLLPATGGATNVGTPGNTGLIPSLASGGNQGGVLGQVGLGPVEALSQLAKANAAIAASDPPKKTYPYPIGRKNPPGLVDEVLPEIEYKMPMGLAGGFPGLNPIPGQGFPQGNGGLSNVGGGGNPDFSQRLPKVPDGIPFVSDGIPFVGKSDVEAVGSDVLPNALGPGKIPLTNGQESAKIGDGQELLLPTVGPGPLITDKKAVGGDNIPTVDEPLGPLVTAKGDENLPILNDGVDQLPLASGARNLPIPDSSAPNLPLASGARNVPSLPLPKIGGEPLASAGTSVPIAGERPQIPLGSGFIDGFGRR